MAAIYIPIINQFRFHAIGDRFLNIDAVENNLYNLDEQDNNTNYNRGDGLANSYPDWLINKSLSMQLVTINTSNTYVSIIDPDGVSATFTRTARQSVAGGIYAVYAYTPTKLGLHRIKVIYFATGQVEEYYSDYFNVRNNTKQDMYEIQYYDTENRNSGYFNDGTEWIWQPYAYYTSKLEPTDPEIERTIYSNQPGNSILLQSTGSRDAIFLITDISKKYINVIAQQIKSEYFFINRVQYTCKSLSSSNIADNTNVCNIELEISETNNNGFYNIN